MKPMSIKVFSIILLIAMLAIPLAGCNSSPTAIFSYTPAAPAAGDTIAFSDGSSDSDGNIVSWAWNFGDGGTSTAQNPTHAYSAAGSYTVTLTVTDDGGADDSYSETVTVTVAPPEMDRWDAIQILVEEIIPPAASEDRIAAFMLSEPLQAGDTVSSESGTSYDIASRSFLIFIDDNPEAFFAHATRFVIMNAVTGDYEIYNNDWPPEINGLSMWDSQLGRGHIISLWSVLDIPMPQTPVASNAPEADYGDAPDGQYAYYGIPGHYPTLYNTSNSHFNLPGGHTLNVGEETLGLRVSAEVDALDPNDPDGMPNLVDADKDERIYVIIEETEARLAFTVSVSLNAPDMTRYANALIDFDYSGNWSESSVGKEWVTVNLPVDIDPGDSETILTPLFDWANATLPPSGVWMRLALTRTEVDENLYANVGGWDGSGQFAYGEIEDHLVFLTAMPPQPEYYDYWPPPPPNGNGNGNGGGGGEPEPGPEKGPCGYNINYLVLVISCGDKASHIAQGMPIVQEASSSMEAVTQAQGYSLFDSLEPSGAGASQTSLDNIEDAIDDLAAEAKCGDHVLIYICGHGKKSGGGGICIYNSSGGRTGESLTPSDLADMLSAFNSCKDADCGTDGCCHVSVIIESCYAGNFNIPGLNDNENIVVSGSSSNTPAQGCMPGGGVYTAGFVSDSQDPNADLDIPPNGVDPVEAHASASSEVSANNARTGKSQQPWTAGNWCDCKCPCQASIDVEKWIWLDPYGWVKEVEAMPGDVLVFMLEIDNDGVCRDVIDLEIIDLMDDCLEYTGEPVLYYNGEPLSYRPPDSTKAVVGGTQLSWSLSEAEIGPLSPEDSIAIEYYVQVLEPGLNFNTLIGSAHCSYDYDNVVTDDDSVAVYVGQEQEPVAEDVLYGWLEVGAQCQCDYLNNCVDCSVYCTFGADDISAQLGPYPVTNVVLYVNGVKVHDSGSISQTHYSSVYNIPSAGCGQTYNFQLVATNSIGLTVTGNQPITTPLTCD